MFTRLLTIQNNESFLLLGPRGTGKSTYIKQQFPEATYIDLLDSNYFQRLSASPARLAEFIKPGAAVGIQRVIIDEIQRIPELMNEVHRLIEKKTCLFGLTGSSARKLRKTGTNLLAGRAISHEMHPLTTIEIGNGFLINHALNYGMLPRAATSEDPQSFLRSYVQTYLREEVQAEGLTRNIGAFSRFLEAASFSQANVLNITEVARECEVERKVVENYFAILEDLLIAVRVPVFTKRAKRQMATHPKFYFFDTGVFRSIRPQGPLDGGDVIPGASFETLVFQNLRALNSYKGWGFSFFFWRTKAGLEVDFIMYGKKGMYAIEVKSSVKADKQDLKSLKEFKADYPMASCILVYGGKDALSLDGVEVLSLPDLMLKLQTELA